MKPERHFRFKGKREIFAVVGFRYDAATSLKYVQFKESKSVSNLVQELLDMESPADVISIRRIYLDKDETKIILSDDPRMEIFAK